MRPAVILALFLLLSACRESARKLTSAEIFSGAPIELSNDQVLTGLLPPGATKVVVRLRVAEAQMLRAEVAAALGSDFTLKILQNNAALAAVDDQPEDGAEELPPVLLAPGEAQIEISAKSAHQAPLQFFYRLFRAPANVEREPNQTPRSATAMAALHASGFYGPVSYGLGGDKIPEQDCFSYALAAEKRVFLDVRLSGVEGIEPSLLVYADDALSAPFSRTGKTGKHLQLTGLDISGAKKVTICVIGTKQRQTVSRDYYDLVLAFGATANHHEVEPNEKKETATEVAQGAVTGALASLKDADFFQYRNLRDYAVSLRVELQPKPPGQMRLMLHFADGREQKFERSAPSAEIAENVRLESGDQLFLAVRPGAAVKRLTAPATYEVKISESQASDENEAEPNGTAASADTLVDATYKWGFINPPGDIDYYRLKVTGKVYRQVRIESKLACKLMLEHQRAGKTLKSISAVGTLAHEGDFRDEDLLRLACAGQKAEPAERAYRIALVE